jgi:hypothetical protein
VGDAPTNTEPVALLRAIGRWAFHYRFEIESRDLDVESP